MTSAPGGYNQQNRKTLLQSLLEDQALQNHLMLYLMSRHEHSATLHELVRPGRSDAIPRKIPVNGYGIMRRYFNRLPHLFWLVDVTPEVCRVYLQQTSSQAVVPGYEDQYDDDDEGDGTQQEVHHSGGGAGRQSINTSRRPCCKICDVTFQSVEELTAHVKTDAHQRVLAANNYQQPSYGLPLYTQALQAAMCSPPAATRSSTSASGVPSQGASTSSNHHPAATTSSSTEETTPATCTTSLSSSGTCTYSVKDASWEQGGGVQGCHVQGGGDVQQAEHFQGAGSREGPCRFYTEQPDWLRCSTCRETFQDEHERREHFMSSRHRLKQAAKVLRQNNSMFTDVGCVVVSVPREDTDLTLGEEGVLEVTVLNNGDQPLDIVSFNLLRQTEGISVCDGGSQPAPGYALTLVPGGSETFKVTICPQAVGMLVDVLVLDFSQSDWQFSVARRITASCDPEFGADLPDISASAPWTPPPRPQLDWKPRQIVRGQPPPKAEARVPFKFPPGKHPVPDWLATMITEARWDEVEAELSAAPTTLKAYTDKMAKLQWIEELQHEVDIRHYDLQVTTMQHTDQGLMRLTVHGLAENRPSVMKGDCLYVSRCDGSLQDREFEGYVHRVEQEQVLLRFRDDFHAAHSDEVEYNVRFAVCRTNFNFMQSAIKRAAAGLLHPATVLGQVGMEQAAAAAARGPRGRGRGGAGGTARFARRPVAGSGGFGGRGSAGTAGATGGGATGGGDGGGSGGGDGSVSSTPSTSGAVGSSGAGAQVEPTEPQHTRPPGSPGGAAVADDEASASGDRQASSQGWQAEPWSTGTAGGGGGGGGGGQARQVGGVVGAGVMQHLAQIVHEAQQEREQQAGAEQTSQAEQQQQQEGQQQEGQQQDGDDEPRWTTEQINDEQKRAVRSILSGGHAPLPYLIFGPPGTGKTMTLTEAAVQVFLSHRSSRLLLAAPSNAAADEVAMRILTKLNDLKQRHHNTGGAAAGASGAGHLEHLDGSHIFRCCAYSRPPADMPGSLRCFSNLSGDGFEVPTLDTLHSKRIVLVTCLMAAKLHALGLGPGFFTHVFIDEAGHAEEPLTLAAMAGLLPNDASARVVLAGDPKQLGPVILSPLAQKHGLSTSAMERLLGVEPYTRNPAAPPPYNSTFITKLIVNYRSHDAILKLPNEAFYHGELVPRAPKAQRDSLLSFKALPNKSFPIIFHGVVGADEREGNSPSWFNQLEAKLVLQYVNELQNMRVGRPNCTEIGIVSPYRKQVQKIRELLSPHYRDSIKVASVEEFQGQERRVILISTVRSSTDHLEFDTRHRLGFLSNPKRFNVAITRAKALVVVVGNPQILQHDDHWMAFLQFVYRNGAHVGCPMPPEVVAAAEAAQAAGLPLDHVWPPYKPPSPAALPPAPEPDQEVKEVEDGSYPAAADFSADGHVWEAMDATPGSWCPAAQETEPAADQAGGGAVAGGSSGADGATAAGAATDPVQDAAPAAGGEVRRNETAQDTEEHVRLADILSRLMWSGQQRPRPGGGYGQGGQRSGYGWIGGDGDGDGGGGGEEEGYGYGVPDDAYAAVHGGGFDDEGGGQQTTLPGAAALPGKGGSRAGEAAGADDTYLPIDEGNHWVVGHFQVEGAEIPRVD